MCPPIEKLEETRFQAWAESPGKECNIPSQKSPIKKIEKYIMFSYGLVFI